MLGLLPAPLRHRLIAAKRRPLYDILRKVGLVYVHVPRTGGTSVSEHVFGQWIDHFTMNVHLLTMPPDVLALPRFTVVRNPWDRALSAWSFASAGTGLDAKIFVRHAHNYRSESFRTFERFVLEWLPEQNVDRCDLLFLKQSGFLTNAEGQLHYDHIGRLERMNETEAWLADVLGRPVTLPHYNRSAHGNYRDCYTAEMRDTIARLYAEDIDRLGYTF